MAFQIDHGARPAGGVGGVLAGPEQQQKRDNDALPANGEEKLAAPTATVELFNLIRGEDALFDRDESVGHGYGAPAGFGNAVA